MSTQTLPFGSFTSSPFKENVMPDHARHSLGSASSNEALALEAALALRVGLDENAVAARYGFSVLRDAWPRRTLSLKRVVADALALERGYRCDNPEDIQLDGELLSAALKTEMPPALFANVAGKRFLDAYRAQPLAAPHLCDIVELRDFKGASCFRLTDGGDLEPLGPDGEIKAGKAHVEAGLLKLATFAKMFFVTREQILNDDLEALRVLPALYGARAARKVDQLFFHALLRNPDGFFSDPHRNYAAGPDSALSAESLTRARALLDTQTDADGLPICVPAKYLLVPPELEVKARQLTGSAALVAVAGGAAQASFNPLSALGLQVVVSPFLSNATSPNASARGWYLFADPVIAPAFQLAFLKGKRVPTVQVAGADFERLGQRLRVYFDIAAKELDWRGAVFFRGE